MRLRTVLPLGILAISAFALAAQAMELKWTPKVGDKATYKIDGSFEIEGLGEIKLGGSRVETITSVDAEKIVSESATTMIPNVMGNEMDAVKSKEMVTAKPDGTVIEVKENDKVVPPAALRLAHITMFAYPTKPVDVNDTWTVEGAKDEKLDLPGYKIEYKLVGAEKVGAWDVWKVTAKGSEIEGDLPSTVQATFWVSKTDGSMVRSLSQLSNIVFPRTRRHAHSAPQRQDGHHPSALMLSTIALLVLAPTALAWSPKAGDQARYRIGAVIDLQGQEGVLFGGTLDEKVRSVEDGLVTTEVVSQLSVDMAGVNRQGLPVESVRVQKIDGDLVTASKIDATLLFATPRVDRLRSVYQPAKPVEIGSGWWRTQGKAEGSPPFASYLTLSGEEKIGEWDTWKIALDATEADDPRPIHVKGMVWIDKTDGSLVKGQWSIDGFAFSPTAALRNARYELTREALSPLRTPQAIAVSASSLVALGRADEHDGVVLARGLSVHRSIGMACGRAALHADRAELYHVVGDREERGHGSEGFPAEVLIQAREHDLGAPIREFHREIDDRIVEELRLLDEDHVGFRIEFGAEVRNVIDRDRLMPNAHMGHDHGLVVTVVDLGFEHLHLTLGIQRATGETDEFLAFSGEHRAADHGDLSERFRHRTPIMESYRSAD